MTLWAKSCNAAANNSLARNTETALHAADAVYGALPLPRIKSPSSLRDVYLFSASSSVWETRNIPRISLSRSRQC